MDKQAEAAAVAAAVVVAAAGVDDHRSHSLCRQLAVATAVAVEGRHLVGFGSCLASLLVAELAGIVDSCFGLIAALGMEHSCRSADIVPFVEADIVPLGMCRCVA